MKKYLLLLACTAFLGQSALAEEFIGEATLKDKTLKDINALGDAHLTNTKADSLSVLGTLEFHNLTVAKDASVVGPIEKSEKGTFGTLNVAGTMDAKDVTAETLVAAGIVTVAGLTVSGDATIGGQLTLKSSKEAPNKLKNLTISAEEIVLEDTDVEGNIVVKKLKGLLGTGGDKQVLRLTGKTTVKGTITFDSGTGTIEQGPDVKVEGKVTGATVEKK